MKKQKNLDLDYSYKIMSFMGELVAGADHEINNLIMMIEGSSKIINDKNTSAEQKTLAMEEMHYKTKRIKEIMTDLRSILKDGSDDSIRTFFIKDLMAKGIALCKTRFKNHRIFIASNIDPESTVEGKETQLVQALLAVLTSSHDSIINHSERWIKVQVNDSNNELSLTINDSGNAFSTKDLDNIFNHNYVSEDGRKSIGIIMAKAIIESHKGSLSIFNNEHNIPTIQLVLPRNQPVGLSGLINLNKTPTEEIEIFNEKIINVADRKVA